MLRWVLILFVVSIVAAFFGLGGIASLSVGVAKLLFWAFLVVCALASLTVLVLGGRPGRNA